MNATDVVCTVVNVGVIQEDEEWYCQWAGQHVNHHHSIHSIQPFLLLTVYVFTGFRDFFKQRKRTNILYVVVSQPVTNCLYCHLPQGCLY